MEDDDYGFDDLDDAAIDVIDAIESHFVTASQVPPSNQIPPLSQGPLVAGSGLTGKPTMQVVESSWNTNLNQTWQMGIQPLATSSRPLIRVVPSNSTDEFDDIPEISVTSDGSYFVASSSSKAAPETPLAYIPIKLSHAAPGVNHASTGGHSSVEQKEIASRNLTGLPASRALSAVNDPGSMSRNVLPPPLQPPSTSALHDRPMRSPVVLVNTLGSQSQMDDRNSSHHDNSGLSTIDSSSHSLATQLAMLQTETEKLKKSLQEAEDSRLMKEGEASNIRRLMEKQAQSHIEHVENLRRERDAKIAAAMKSHDSLQSTIEGLKTQLAFKQHDMDTSSRKWNAGSSARKKSSQISSSQTPLRKGNAKAASDPWLTTTPNSKTPITPAKTLLAHAQMAKHRHSPVMDPSSSRAGANNGMNGEYTNAPQFSTFYNSFAKAKSPVKKRVKRARDEEQMESSPFRPREDEEPDHHVNRANHPQEMGPHFGDILAVDDPGVSQEDPTGTSVETWRVDWRQELHALIFGHVVSGRDSDTLDSPPLTLQVLLSTQPPGDVSAIDSTSLRQGSALILAAFSAHPRQEDWDDLLRDITKGFVISVTALASLKLTSSLIPVLRLLELLAVVIPRAAAHLLSSLSDDRRGSSALVVTLADLICSRFLPPSLSVKEQQRDLPPARWDIDKTKLVRAVLGVIESLARNTTVNEAERLRPLIEKSECFLCLTDRRQPSWLVEYSMRVLVTLSSHAAVLRPLFLAAHDTGPREREPFESRPSIIKQLSQYLVSRHRHSTEEEFYLTTESILVTIACILEADEQGFCLLRESVCMVPSLVAALMQLSAPLFEDDQMFADQDGESQLRLIRNIYLTAHLLWTIVNPSVPVVNLRTKLQHAAAVDPLQFNGLLNVFIVSLGRLSFADPPEYVSPQARDALLQAAELSRDLLDAVVEGPDGDSIWEAYQPQGDSDDDEHSLLEQEMARDLEMNGRES
ncbi:hypothetical protein FRB94_010519 [Tulasnella sp. JGI-2019a]|nr:hypothetical protein FRB94_010519 [Tulasnella sp. JGI-2019a]KAG9035589.1 hypothetical protein FRB95_010995 [Tulasnella sp. JGI-2019a]